jgi:hypothetical protein
VGVAERLISLAELRWLKVLLLCSESTACIATERIIQRGVRLFAGPAKVSLLPLLRAFGQD